MKQTLAFDQRAGQFKADVGKPSKRFYLGADADAAQERKLALVRLWERHRAEGHAEWTPAALKVAEAIRKGDGSGVELRHTPGESTTDFAELERKVVKLAGAAVPVRTAVTAADLAAATEAILSEKIARLEQLVRDHIGAGAVTGAAVTIHAALDAFHEYRRTTEINPDTNEPTEHVRTEGNNVKLIKRLVPADMPLSRLNFIELQKWAKAVANRPASLKTGNPIKRTTARNCLKVIRLFVRWASQNYGWKKPDDWHDATLTMTRRTKDERRESLKALTKHYTPEEIGVLWKFALPSERMLILLGLNFGYAQQEIIDMHPEDVAAEEVAAIRGKSGVFGKWAVWPETRELAATEFARIPKRRQHIANRWNKLMNRVRKDIPDFKELSFKWLRKTGASLIRKVSTGEIASTYLSHGEAAATDDDLLTVYADTDWNGVCDAVRKLREQLLPHLQAEAVTARTYIARSTIDKIRDGWRAGLKAEKIMKAAGVSRATVYRYKVAREAAAEEANA